MKLISHIVDALTDALVPRVCLMCGTTLVRGEQHLCLDCMMRLPRTHLHHDTYNELMHRLGREMPVAMASGWIWYLPDAPSSFIIKNAKYADRPALARWAARIYARELMADGALTGIDVLLPVPMHWAKRLRRGYNQAREVAVAMSEVTGIPVGDNLVSLKPHGTQTRHNAMQRIANIKGTIGLTHPDELHGLHVAVVDDVVTTGATLTECLHVLREARPDAVSVLSLGVTRLN